jgi:putative tryptophan/tyrosine transport system substrate-binding protein
MTKNNVLVALSVTLLTAFIVLKKRTPAAPKTRFTVGILQTASHPALDAARDGFVQELTATLNNDVTFVTRNGEGSVPTIHAAAQQFHNEKHINAIFAIATPAAQAMAAVEHDKPIIIAAVTDPHALGMISPTTNITGVSDMTDIPLTIDMLTALVPTARKVGLLYNNGETNSLAATKLMRAQLEKRGLAVLDFAINNEADMPVAAQTALGKSDVVLAPTDNTVAASITLLATQAHKAKKPLIVSDNMLVKAGALAARGVDYHNSGKQAATIAHDLLVNNTKPYTIPVQQPESGTAYINTITLNDLGLVVPEALKNNVTIIE